MIPNEIKSQQKWQRKCFLCLHLFFFTAAGFEDRFDITFERAKYGQNSGKVAAKCTSVTQR